MAWYNTLDEYWIVNGELSLPITKMQENFIKQNYITNNYYYKCATKHRYKNYVAAKRK